jgi:hypothetical protein
MTAKSKKTPKQPAQKPEPTQKSPISSTESSVSDFAAETAPVDLQSELEGTPVDFGPGSSQTDPIRPEIVDNVRDMRSEVRVLWVALGATGEALVGPELHLDDPELDLLADIWVGPAERWGVGILDNEWLQLLTAMAGTAAMLTPKLRAAGARRASEGAVEVDIGNVETVSGPDRPTGPQRPVIVPDPS